LKKTSCHGEGSTGDIEISQLWLLILDPSISDSGLNQMKTSPSTGEKALYIPPWSSSIISLVQTTSRISRFLAQQRLILIDAVIRGWSGIRGHTAASSNFSAIFLSHDN
jgi:hypothetical protein